MSRYPINFSGNAGGSARAVDFRPARALALGAPVAYDPVLAAIEARLANLAAAYGPRAAQALMGLARGAPYVAAGFLLGVAAYEAYKYFYNDKPVLIEDFWLDYKSSGGHSYAVPSGWVYDPNPLARVAPNYAGAYDFTDRNTDMAVVHSYAGKVRDLGYAKSYVLSRLWGPYPSTSYPSGYYYNGRAGLYTVAARFYGPPDSDAVPRVSIPGLIALPDRQVSKSPHN